MILIGQYDSPFVRRVGVALKCYALPFEHRAWSVWGDRDKIRDYSPLCRVPVLVLSDGTALSESFVILEAIDELVGPERALLPRSGPVRREGLRIAALCTGICDKGVSLLYGSLQLMQPSVQWQERCKLQIGSTLQVLEAERAVRHSPHWLGESLSHADVAFACAFRFLQEAQPSLVEASRYPSLAAHAARCEALPEFREISLPLTNNL